MDKLQFTDKEKIRAFDRLSECFLNRNYGSVSKSDIELLFFSFVWEHLKNNNHHSDDYSISNLLGITQQRVRNLKVKCQLRNQYKYDWIREFCILAQNIHYSLDDKMVTLCLDNPILMIEVQHWIEDHNGYVDYTLNPKLLKMPTRNFAELLVGIGMRDNPKQVMQELRKNYLANSECDEEITKEKLIERVKNDSLSFVKDIITGTISGVLSNKFVL